MTFLQNLYLARFSLLSALFLIAFPAAVLWFGFSAAYFGGLFDVSTFWPTFWVTCSAYLLSWSATITFQLTTLYGPERLGADPSKCTDFIEARRGAKALFLFGLLLPIPMFVSLLKEKLDWDTLSGFLGGLLFTLVIVCLADLVQRLFNRFQGSEKEDAAKTLFFPFASKLSTMAEESTLVREVFQGSIFKALGTWIRRIPLPLVGFVKRNGDTVTINPGMVLATVMFGIFLVLYTIAFYSSVYQSGLYALGVTTLTYVFILVTFLCWLLAGAAFVFDRYRFPTFVLVLFVLAFAALNHTYKTTPITDPSVRTDYATPEDILKARLERNQPYLIFVAANGGGIQSSAWATEILTRFDENCAAIDSAPDGCRNAITVLSGVSGGSVGSMYFMDAFDGYDDARKRERIRKYSQQSSLANVGAALVFQDFVRNIPLVSYCLENDRGKTLAHGWVDNKALVDRQMPIANGWVQSLNAGAEQESTSIAGKLSAWRKGVKDGHRPAVIFNSTIVESGQRLLFSTANFDRRNIDSDTWLTMDDLIGEDTDIDITEAVRLSAAYAYVSPVPSKEDPDRDRERFPGHRYHLADGGYADNYGLLSVRDFLEEGLKDPSSYYGPKPKILIIQIYGEEVERDPDTGKKRKNAFGLMSWFQQLVAPLSTLLNVRSNGQFARNDETFRSIQVFAREKGFPTPERFIFEFPTPKNQSVPLSWHLTERNIKSIEDAGTKAFENGGESPDETVETRAIHEENRRNWELLKGAILTARSTK